MKLVLAAFTKNAFNFRTRASRKEYWLSKLFLIMLFFVSIIIAPSLCALGSILSIIPMLALQVRRLHDVNKNGWTLLLSLVPGGALIMLYFFCKKGTAGPNRFGPNPLERTSQPAPTN